jgi:hypothetical protein
MKNIKVFLSIFIISCSAICMGYPTNFSYLKYINPVAYDQKAQGPCHSFATIAGMEAMYNLYFGVSRNFSERALYNTKAQMLSTALEIAKTKGVINETCNQYPDTIPCSEFTRQPLESIDILNYDWVADQTNCKNRVKIDYVNVTTTSPTSDYIKSLLLKYGPIITGDVNHSMLLYGWQGSYFLFKDSYPCHANIARNEPLSYFTNVEMYAITNITEENYSSVWTNVTLTKKAFTLNYPSENYIVTLNKPSCFNSGTYSVNLSNIPEAAVYSWSVNNPGINLIVSSDTQSCTLSGNGTGVKLTVVVKRKSNNLLEEFVFNIGTVGVPSFTVNKTSAYCAGNNYEITTKITHDDVPGISYSYSYNIPPLHNYSYVIKNGAYAYWVFKAPETVNYSATVTYSKTGCSSIQKTINTYIYSLPCGGYYKSASEGISENVNNDNLNSIARIPDQYTLEQNYPNPFNPATIISYKLPISSLVTIKVYDVLGREMQILVNEYQSAGIHSVTFNAGNLPGGVYFYKLRAGNYIAEKKLLLLK